MECIHSYQTVIWTFDCMDTVYDMVYKVSNNTLDWTDAHKSSFGSNKSIHYIIWSGIVLNVSTCRTLSLSQGILRRAPMIIHNRYYGAKQFKSNCVILFKLACVSICFLCPCSVWCFTFHYWQHHVSGNNNNIVINGVSSTDIIIKLHTCAGIIW